MDKRNHIKLLHRDREGWNAWRKDHPEIRPVLQGANLRGRMLRGFNLRDALLDGADLRDANLRKADLSLASLQEAKLHRAFLSRANLRGVVFTGARLYETVFSDADLTDARGLENCIHLGPSTLDHRTLSRSGRLPTEFLRGCGLSDEAIQALDSPPPSRYHSCFISYSTSDEQFVKRLYDDLQRRGVRCWFAPKDIRIGERIRTSIDCGIRGRERLLLVLSEAAAKSPWVEKEVETAFEEERRRGDIVLFPIRLDDAAFSMDAGWVADVRRSRHVGDFRDWRTAKGYEEALDRLLRDLREDAGAQQGV